MFTINKITFINKEIFTELINFLLLVTLIKNYKLLKEN